MTAGALFKRLLAERIPAIELIDGMNNFQCITLNMNGMLDADGVRPDASYSVDVDKDGVAKITEWVDEIASWKDIKRGLKTEDEVVAYLVKLMERVKR